MEGVTTHIGVHVCKVRLQAACAQIFATVTPRIAEPATIAPHYMESWMDLLSLEHFTGSVNDTFSAQLNEGEIAFVLVEARPLKAVPGAQRTPFSLLFRNASAFLFPQQIYRMRHRNLGEVGIFLVPVARERDGFLYQAVFN